jgi:uncharacterized protein (TIGR03067 family)
MPQRIGSQTNGELLRQRFALLVAVLLPTLSGVVAAGVLLQTPRPERTVLLQLQGAWDLEALYANGEPVPAAELHAKLTVRGDWMALRANGNDATGIVRIESDGYPVRFTWTVKGNILHGILALRPEGLTLCPGPPGVGREAGEFPTDFTPGPGKSVQYYRRGQS